MQLVFASTGIVLLALTLILTDTNQVIGQPSQPQRVEVVNGTEKPVPVIAAPVAADYVTLADDFGQTGECPVGTSTERILPDGTRVPFVVPRGRVLVLTDMTGTVRRYSSIQWQASHVGYIAALVARIEGGGQTQFFTAETQVNSAAVSAQILPVQVHLQSGVVAGSGSIVCIVASLSYSNGGFIATGHARLHGYLMNQ